MKYFFFFVLSLLFSAQSQSQYLCGDFFQQSQTCQGIPDTFYCQLIDICLATVMGSTLTGCQEESLGNITSFTDQMCQMPVPGGELPVTPQACVPTPTGSLMLGEGLCGVDLPTFNSSVRVLAFEDDDCLGNLTSIIDASSPETCINGPDNSNIMITGCTDSMVELTLFTDRNCATAFVITELPVGFCINGIRAECDPMAFSAETTNDDFTSSGVEVLAFSVALNGIVALLLF